MSNKKWCKGFVVGKATHKEVKKTPEQLNAERERRRRIADLDERKLLREWKLL